MNESEQFQRAPLLLKRLTPDRVSAILKNSPNLILPVGTTEQHGPHLPLGCDTIIVDRLADDLSAEFQVLRAPTLEYGVNADTKLTYPGAASLSRKTLHRVLNELVGMWEDGGVKQFIIITAHGQDPHLEALSTLTSHKATIRTVDIFSLRLDEVWGSNVPVHGGRADTSLLLYIDSELVHLELARDYIPSTRSIRRYHRGSSRAIPLDSPGSLGHPSRASFELGERLYHFIFDRIATRIFGRRPVGSRAEGADG